MGTYFEPIWTLLPEDVAVLKPTGSVPRMCKTPKWIFAYSNDVVCCVNNRNPIPLIFRKLYQFNVYVIKKFHKTHFRIERSIYIYVDTCKQSTVYRPVGPN